MLLTSQADVIDQAFAFVSIQSQVVVQKQNIKPCAKF